MKSKKKQILNRQVLETYYNLYNMFGNYVDYKIIYYSSSTYVNVITDEIIKFVNSLKKIKNIILVNSDLDMIAFINPLLLNSSIRLFYASYHSFYLLNESLKWFKLYPNLFYYENVIVYDSLDKEFLLERYFVEK